jgi:Flp pilus assembly protein TadD
VEQRTEYEETLDLAESGQHSLALDNIRQRLAQTPEDAEALNDAGVILHCLKCSEEAVEHLEKAHNLAPESPEIVWNLVETYLAADKPHQAEPLFDDMEAMGILSADVLNRTANAFLNNGDIPAALGMLRRSLEFSPEQEILVPMIEILEKA